MSNKRHSEKDINASDMRQAVSQVRESMEHADIQECDDIACVLEKLLKNITSSQKTISRQMNRVSSNV